MPSPGVEIEDIVASLRSIEANLGKLLSDAGGPSEMDVWRVYAGTEMAVAKLKARLDYETPGLRFVLPKGDDKALLEGAKERLSRGLAALESGRHAEAIGLLREARNMLRSYLTEKRRAATRKKVVRPSG